MFVFICFILECDFDTELECFLQELCVENEIANNKIEEITINCGVASESYWIDFVNKIRSSKTCNLSKIHCNNVEIEVPYGIDQILTQYDDQVV